MTFSHKGANYKEKVSLSILITGDLNENQGTCYLLLFFLATFGGETIRCYNVQQVDDANTIEIALEREDHTEIRTYTGSFPSGAVRVVLQDDSYNPPKAPGSVVDPFTWHWDNITIETA